MNRGRPSSPRAARTARPPPCHRRPVRPPQACGSAARCSFGTARQEAAAEESGACLQPRQLLAHNERFLRTRALRWGLLRRQYLEENLVNFAEANPHMQIAVAPRPNRHPFVRGWYLRDGSKTLSLRNLSAAQIVERLHFLRDMRPVGLRKFAKPFRTSPSVQGEWQLGQLLRPHLTLRA